MTSLPLPTPPDQPPLPPPARDIEVWLSRVLAVGVLLAAFTIVFGGCLYLGGHAGDTVNLSTYAPQPMRLTDPRAIFDNALKLQPLAVIQLGLLMLVLTPVLRVTASLVLFALKRDKLYVVITLLVLATLAFGLLGNLK